MRCCGKSTDSSVLCNLSAHALYSDQPFFNFITTLLSVSNFIALTYFFNVGCILSFVLIKFLHIFLIMFIFVIAHHTIYCVSTQCLRQCPVIYFIIVSSCFSSNEHLCLLLIMIIFIITHIML